MSSTHNKTLNVKTQAVSNVEFLPCRVSDNVKISDYVFYEKRTVLLKVLAHPLFVQLQLATYES